MKPVKSILSSLIMLILLSGFSQCSNNQKLENTPPIDIGEVYYKKQPQAVRDLQSVMTLFLPINSENRSIELDSVYFRGQLAKLKVSNQNENLYFARFVMNSKHKNDIILSRDMGQEHQNQLPKKEQSIPFELKQNECIISYKQEGKVKYYKITNIKEIRTKDVPMSPRNNE